MESKLAIRRLMTVVSHIPQKANKAMLVLKM